MADKSFYAPIDTKLDNAGLAMNVATWVMIRVAAVVGAALLLATAAGQRRWSGCSSAGSLGYLVSGMWLNSRQSARRKAFEEELPDFLMLIASALRSGLSFQQGLDSSAADGKGEVSRQMRRALREVQMGSLLEPALVRVGGPDAQRRPALDGHGPRDPARGGRQPLEHPRDGREHDQGAAPSCVAR